MRATLERASFQIQDIVICSISGLAIEVISHCWSVMRLTVQRCSLLILDPAIWCSFSVLIDNKPEQVSSAPGITANFIFRNFIDIYAIFKKLNPSSAMPLIRQRTHGHIWGPAQPWERQHAICQLRARRSCYKSEAWHLEIIYPYLITTWAVQLKTAICFPSLKDVWLNSSALDVMSRDMRKAVLTIYTWVIAHVISIDRAHHIGCSHVYGPRGLGKLGKELKCGKSLSRP